MADQIVACPKCQKKYKVGEGSPAGEFQCTQCGSAVTYGASPAVAQAKPVQARGVAPGRAPGGARGDQRGGGPRGGRGPGRARGGYASRGRGRARGGARGRGQRYAEDDEMGYGPPPKDNTMMYVLLGVIAVLIVGGGIAFVAMSGGDDKEDRREVANNPNAGNPGVGGPGVGVSPGIGMPGIPTPVAPTPVAGNGGAARPGLQRRPDPEPGTGPDAKPDPGTGSGTGSSRRTGGSSRRPLRRAPPSDADLPDDLHGADKLLLKRMTVKQFLMRDIPHLDDTTAEQKSQIDTACRYLVDYSAAKKQTDAVGFLARIGRPAFPRVLSSFKNVTSSWTEPEGRTCICLVNETLWEILHKRYPDTYMVRLSQMSNQSEEVLQENVRRWFVWWYSEGYKLETFDQEEEEEDTEDD